MSAGVRHGSWVSAVVVALCCGGGVQAADLGGNCCADLEERIAELEATAARKGNRKVSLAISGWVSSQIFFWDDGHESNAYVVDTSTDLASNFKFSGSAQISPGWKAGFLLNVYTDPGNSLASNQSSIGGAAVTTEHAFWYIESDALGKVSVGRQSGAADNAVVFTDFSGTLFPANTVMFDGDFMRLRPDGGGYANGLGGTWQAFVWCETVGIGIGGDCAGLRSNAVKYETPKYAGFGAAVSWGEDDQVDFLINYAGEFSGFKVAAASAYTMNTDNNGALGSIVDTEYFQIGGTIKHLPSKLWLHGSYGHEYTDTAGVPDATNYFIKAGWSPRFFPIGDTHFYAEYTRYSDAYGDLAGATHPGATCAAFFGVGGNLSDACASAVDTTVNITDSTVERFGAGIVQEIDAASMSLWAKWRMLELDVKFDDAGTAGKQSFDDLQMFLAGAVIFF